MAILLTATNLYGNAERASITSTLANLAGYFPGAFMSGLLASYPGSNLPLMPVGRYGAFNNPANLQSIQFPCRFGPRVGFFAHSQISRGNTGGQLTWPYGN